MSARREVWITGVGLLTCLGEGMEANWQRLERGDAPPYDDKTFAPYIVHPLPAMSFDKQIPKKADQRQMELWQRAGTYAAGLALSDAGIAGKPDLLDRTDMIVAAGGGERDVAADNAILAGVRKANRPDVFLNERLMSDLRPTLFLAQLPNLLAGNISLVHGVVGSSRTFMGEEAAGVDSVRVAQARVASGQSELTLVGGAYNGARWDVLLAFELGHVLLQNKFAPVWDRGPNGGIAFATMGAFLVLESPEHAQARGAKPRARLSEIHSDRNLRGPGETEAALRRQWEIDRRQGRPGACRRHFRRQRHRARDRGGTRRAQGIWPSRSQYRYVYRAWGRDPVSGQSGDRLRRARARQAVRAGRQRRYRR